MWDWLTRVFGAGFMPHGHCWLWSPSMVWLQVLSNVAIGLAYVSISATLYYIIRRIRDVPFSWMYIAFGVFIVTCGATHFSEVVTIWHPIYWVDGGLRVITASASVGTALLLIPLVPKAIALADAAQHSHARGVELEQAYRDLARAHEHTQELERAKDAFFANASHDLRTPLALILAPVERLLERHELSDEAREELEIARRNARTLLKHVNDLLDVSKLEAKRLEPTWTAVDLAELVRATTELFEGASRSKPFALEVKAPAELRVECDPDQIQRVLANLLSNAVKYVPRAGHVRVHLESVNGSVRISVTDDGIGVPDTAKATVFERYRSVDSDVDRIGGTGLGLSIAKELTELHRGTIRVEDAPGGGARFVVTLPKKAPVGAEVRPYVGVAQPLLEGDVVEPRSVPRIADDQHPSVLVVEDHPDMRRHLARVLGDVFSVATACDGRDAIARLGTFVPDLIVTDLMMPGATGEELVEYVRSTAQLAEVPIVVLSARADEATRIGVLRAGADDYVIKPFAAEELRTRAANLVRTSRARRALRAELATVHGDVEQLAMDLAARKRDLEAALSRVEAASRAKDAFLTLVSHEIRTPITSIQVQLELLRRGAKGPRVAEAHTRMQRALDRLTKLLEDVLEYANFLSGAVPIELTELDVAEVVDAEIARLGDTIEKKGLTIEQQADPRLPKVRTDERLLRLALRNLLSNAVQYTEHGTIRTRLARCDGGVRIEIHDTGPGIPPEELSRVFLPFEQLGDMRHKHLPGIGLGLTLVRLVHERLRGKVEVESKVGEGTTFLSFLPSLESAT